MWSTHGSLVAQGFLFLLLTVPAQYSCKCQQGYFGNGKICLPRYGEVNPKELLWEYAANRLSFFNVTQMKEGRQMVFFPVSDFLPLQASAALVMY